MDYLDPNNERRARRRLFVGYGLVGTLIAIASLVLLYWSYGYNVDKKGAVTQSGMVFVSSQPSNASIVLNDKPGSAKTNSRLVLAAGDYTLRLTKDGYTDWQRHVSVLGGDVQRFDYPLLVPKTLKTTTIASFDTPVSFFSQTPDKRFVLIGSADKPGTFTEYTLADPAKTVARTLELPGSVYTSLEKAASNRDAWKAIEWADGGRYCLVEHIWYAEDGNVKGREFLLLDRRAPSDSTNLTTALNLGTDDKVTLFNRQPDVVYVYRPADKTLRALEIHEAKLVTQLSSVYAYKTYSDDTVLYVTDVPPSGKAVPGTFYAVLQQGQRTTTLRMWQASAGQYLLDIARYDKEWYVLIGADNETTQYIYKNPQTQVLSQPKQLPSPWRTLKIEHPVSAAFSANARFVMVQNNDRFALYDAETVETLGYTAPKPVDNPAQQRPVWMDGHRLQYVSDGKLVWFDYDNQNLRVMQPSLPDQMPIFSPDFHYVYSLKTLGDGRYSLGGTSLITD